MGIRCYKIFILYISFLCVASLVLSCSSSGESEACDDKGHFFASLDSMWACGAHREMISAALPIYDNAVRSADVECKVKTGYRIGRAYYCLFQPDSMYFYFDGIFQEAGDYGMSKERVAMLNTMGVFNMVNAINYSQAIDCFYQAMNISSDSGDWDSYYKSLTNVTIIHYFRKDSEGVESARAIFEYGKKSGSHIHEYTGAVMLAYMYHALGDEGRALDYVNEAMRYPEFSVGAGSSDAIHAAVLAALGRDDEAESMYKRCIDDPATDNSLLLEVLSGYGAFLADRGRYSESVRYYQRGLDITEQYHLYFYGHSIYKELAEIYSKTGKYDLALEYLNDYQEIADNVFNVEKERSFNTLLRKFDRQVSEMELQKKDMQILRQRQSIFLVGGAFVLTSILAAAIYVNYRMRDRMYRNLVVKYNEHLKKERAMAEMTVRESESEDLRLKELFLRLDAMMKDEKLYAKKNINIEDTAKMLGTNRGYISKAVNTFSGMTFNTYINSFRMKAAVDILSDPDDGTPIKVIADRLGYNNLTSFYNNFFKETGVPPSKFRQEARKLKLT